MYCYVIIVEHVRKAKFKRDSALTLSCFYEACAGLLTDHDHRSTCVTTWYDKKSGGSTFQKRPANICDADVAAAKRVQRYKANESGKKTNV